MRAAIWYFDFISPFAYIALHRLKELPSDVAVEYRPVLFAGILNHWGQKGPAEMATKRRYTYRWSHWWARSLGVPLRFPAAHPFNPLHHLRLAIACGSKPEAVAAIFDSIWTGGGDASDQSAFAALCGRLGVSAEALGAPAVKDALRKNTDDAIAHGVFGVPSFEVDGELFWGADSIEFLKDFLKNPSVIDNQEFHRLDSLPQGAVRKAG